MRLDKLAVTAQEAFQNAMGVAGEADAAVIEPIHLLKALLDSDENNLAAIVKRIGADPVWLSQNVADEIAKMPKQTGATPMAIPGQDLIKVIDNSVKIAEKLGDSYATSLPSRACWVRFWPYCSSASNWVLSVCEVTRVSPRRLS